MYTFLIISILCLHLSLADSLQRYMPDSDKSFDKMHTTAIQISSTHRMMNVNHLLASKVKITLLFSSMTDNTMSANPGETGLPCVIHKTLFTNSMQPKNT